jgi:hypothetical protein
MKFPLLLFLFSGMLALGQGKLFDDKVTLGDVAEAFAKSHAEAFKGNLGSCLEIWRGGRFIYKYETLNNKYPIKKSTELSPYKGNSGNGYTAWANWYAGSDSYLGKRFKNLWISYIKNVTNKGKESAPIFEGKRDEVIQKWNKIMASSSSYKWAEQSEGTTSNFPQSIYGNPEYSQPLASPIPFNNSNTFARYVLSNASLSSEVMTSHEFPGNHQPRDVFGKWERVQENP